MLVDLKLSLLVKFLLLLGGLNLLTPFLTKKDSKIRSFGLIAISGCFFANILLIDLLFLQEAEVRLPWLTIGKYQIGLHLEGLGLVFLNMLGLLWFCALLYTPNYLVINNIPNSSRFLFFINLTVLLAVFLALAANLFTMFIFYELLTLSTTPLIAHTGSLEERKGLASYLKILMLSSMLLLLPAIIFIYAKANHGNFTAGGFVGDYLTYKEAVILLLMCIFGISKAALYPLHRWLPAAMVASYPVSALLHAVVVVKAGLFCIYKILIYVFGLEYLRTIVGEFNFLFIFPIFTICYSSLKAIRSENIKMILAYSTISQLSLALLSAFMLTPQAITAAMQHLVSHAFAKILLFYVGGIYYSFKNTKQIRQLIGIAYQLPKTSIVLTIAGLSLIGIPPLAGFISKFYILSVAIQEQQAIVVIASGIGSIFSAIYITKVLLIVYRFNPANLPKKEELTKQVPISMQISLYICCLVILLFFFINKIISKLLINL